MTLSTTSTSSSASTMHHYRFAISNNTTTKSLDKKIDKLLDEKDNITQIWIGEDEGKSWFFHNNNNNNNNHGHYKQRFSLNNKNNNSCHSSNNNGGGNRRNLLSTFLPNSFRRQSSLQNPSSTTDASTTTISTMPLEKQQQQQQKLFIMSKQEQMFVYLLEQLLLRTESYTFPSLKALCFSHANLYINTEAASIIIAIASHFKSSSGGTIFNIIKFDGTTLSTDAIYYLASLSQNSSNNNNKNANSSPKNNNNNNSTRHNKHRNKRYNNNNNNNNNKNTSPSSSSSSSPQCLLFDRLPTIQLVNCPMRHSQQAFDFHNLQLCSSDFPKICSLYNFLSKKGNSNNNNIGGLRYPAGSFQFDSYECKCTKLYSGGAETNILLQLIQGVSRVLKIYRFCFSVCVLSTEMLQNLLGDTIIDKTTNNTTVTTRQNDARQQQQQQQKILAVKFQECSFHEMNSVAVPEIPEFHWDIPSNTIEVPPASVFASTNSTISSGSSASNNNINIHNASHDKNIGNVMQLISQYPFFRQRHVQIKQLQLGGNILTCNDLTGIAQYLNQSYLTHLDLHFANITDDELYNVSECLKTNTTLTHLDLSHNLISNQGIDHLATCLQSNNNTTLIQLNLTKNKITGSSSIVKLLSQSQTSSSSSSSLSIQELIIRHNNMTNNDLQHLAKALKVNTSLTKLDISWNSDISNIGIQYILNVLHQYNTTLQYLLYDGCKAYAFWNQREQISFFLGLNRIKNRKNNNNKEEIKESTTPHKGGQLQNEKDHQSLSKIMFSLVLGKAKNNPFMIYWILTTYPHLVMKPTNNQETTT